MRENFLSFLSFDAYLSICAIICVIGSLVNENPKIQQMAGKESGVLRSGRLAEPLCFHGDERIGRCR